MDPLVTYPIRSDKTAWRVIDEEAVIVIPEESQVKVLNITGSRIWELCDGTCSVSAIIHQITDEFSVKPQEAERDVTDFVTGLAKKGLLFLNTERTK
jgi:hypothetical protein